MRTGILINLNTGTIEIQTDDKPQAVAVQRGPDKKPRKRRRKAKKAVKVEARATAMAVKDSKTG